MEEVKIPPHVSNYQNVSLFLAVVVTVNVLLQILSHWHRFGTLPRYAAVVLLALLVVEPIVFVRAQRQGRLLGRDQLLTFAYMSVMLATIVFALR